MLRPEDDHGPAIGKPASRATDVNSRRAAITLGLTLPADVVLYLLLPMHAQVFGVSLVEVGILLAANRLVRIAGYGWVTKFYAARGDRPTCILAVIASVVCALGYATLSGFWPLLVVRLLWGLSFAALNLSTQVLATEEMIGAAVRTGRSRAFIAAGPMLALPLAAVLSDIAGPRLIFFILAGVALLALALALRLPATGRGEGPVRRPVRRPGSIDAWAFMEGLTLDGLFVIGLAFLGKDLLPDGAVLAAGLLLALRYFAEIVLSPAGGYAAERLGAERVLVALSLVTAAALVGFGAGWLWASAAVIVVLRALQLPLVPPIVARRNPGPDRVRALAACSVWRDIGAGTGPLLAGLLLSAASTLWIYAAAAFLLSLTALACGRRG